MRRNNLVFVIVLTLIIYVNYSKCQYNNSRNINRSEDTLEVNDLTYNTSISQSKSWLDTAKNVIVGPGGEILVHFAKEMISRSTGNCQVLSLNMTNLLLIVLLKALIFAAGLIGAGNWSNYARSARSVDSMILQYDESPLFIGFLAAQGSDQYGCLYRAACNVPNTANQYVKVAKSIVETIKMHGSNFTRRYDNLIQGTEIAIREGKDAAPCNSIYYCPIEIP